MSWYLDVDKETENKIPRMNRDDIPDWVEKNMPDVYPYIQWAKEHLEERKEPTKAVFIEDGLAYEVDWLELSKGIKWNELLGRKSRNS